MAIKQAILEELLKDYKKSEDMFGENGLLQQLKKSLSGKGP